MCALYRKRYRIESARLKGYDYCHDGAYFITICTNKFIPYFGEINSGVITLSGSGKIASRFWTEIPVHFPFVDLDEFIIMPDHIHGIIIIRHSNSKPGGTVVETPKLGRLYKSFNHSGVPGRDAKLGVSTTNRIENSKNPYWKSNSIGSIINQYKRICTINIKIINPGFAWQPRFYDHIIRTSGN